METWTVGAFSSRWNWLQRVIFARVVRSVNTYQPVVLEGKQLTRGDRDCEYRWAMMEHLFRDRNVTSILDLGCAEGYYVLRAAEERGCVALGVDADIRRTYIGQGCAFLQKAQGVGFMTSYVTPDFVNKLPRFDLVICFSLFHHVIISNGLDYARCLMQKIRAVTGKAFVFDMGQSDESYHEWSGLLSMEPDPATWIAAFLKDAGFTSVSILGESASFAGLSKRLLFLATP